MQTGGGVSVLAASFWRCRAGLINPSRRLHQIYIFGPYLRASPKPEHRRVGAIFMTERRSLMTTSKWVVLPLVATSGLALAQETPKASAARDPMSDSQVAAAVERYLEREGVVRASYGKKGFRLESRDGNFQTNLQWRAQLRATSPYRSDPRALDDFDTDQLTAEGRRLRMKLRGRKGRWIGEGGWP